MGLGGTIAKSVLKHWLEDNGVALTAGTGVIDTIRSVVPGVVEQRRGGRQFEQIADKVADDLLPLFERSGLSEDRQRDIAWLANEAIEAGGVKAELLVQRNLDPMELADYFIESQPNEPDELGFSKFELQLYEGIVKRSAAYVVDIASELPRFTERSIAEILSRESQIIDIAGRVLEEFEGIRGGIQRYDDVVARFEADYLEAVIRNLDRVELFGVDVSTASGRQRLTVAYVSLLAISSSLTENGQRKDGVPSEPETQDADDAAAEAEDQREATIVEDILTEGKRLVIRGAAGCGKTTLLRWIAVRAASRTFGDHLEEWNGIVPFFIPLRDFVDAEFPRPEQFPGLVNRAIAGEMPDGWVHDRLRSGDAVVLIDGVDELPKSRRTDLQEWLKELADTFSECRLIVTSRPGAIEERWMRDDGFEECEVQPMGLSDIQEFIRRWHAAVQELLQGEREKEELSSLERNLQDEIRTNRPIRNLATTPLLCAVICALHRDRHQQLPSDRIEIYEACCSMLIERRDVERRVHLTGGDYPQLSYRRKRALLEDLAYWMMRNSYSRVTIRQVDERFDHKLVDITDIAEGVSGTKVREYLLERSGIIREPTAGEIDFAHRTFQEFLAAQAAVNEGDVGVLVDRADDDQWAETIVLAAGLATMNDRERLIKALIERGDNEEQHRHQLHFLAVASLETSVELSQGLRNRIKERLSRLVPPRNLGQAKSLASAGELAVPFLGFDRKFRASEAKASVRTLAEIGGDAALNALKTYATDTRITVIDELITAADSFDSEIYREEVLSLLFADRRALEEAAEAGDIGVLAEFVKRGVLGLSRKFLYDIPVSVIVLLGQNSELRTLNLTGNRLTLLPSEIGQLTNLRRLILTGNWLTSLPPEIGQLTNLQTLSLEGNRLTSLPPEIGQLTNLQTLSLVGNRLASLPSAIGGLTNLRVLNLKSNRLGSLPPEIGQLTSLQNLILWNNYLTLPPEIGRLAKLRYLDLDGNRMTSLPPDIGQLSSLQTLDLRNNQLTTLPSEMGRLTNLRRLVLSGNNITSVPEELRLAAALHGSS